MDTVANIVNKVTPANYIHNTLPGQFEQMKRVLANGIIGWANAYHRGKYHIIGKHFDDCGEWISQDKIEIE